MSGPVIVNNPNGNSSGTLLAGVIIVVVLLILGWWFLFGPGAGGNGTPNATDGPNLPEVTLPVDPEPS